MDSPLEPPVWNPALQISGFSAIETCIGFLIYRTVKGYICVVLRHKVCGNLLKQSQETNIPFKRS